MKEEDEPSVKLEPKDEVKEEDEPMVKVKLEPKDEVSYSPCG